MLRQQKSQNIRNKSRFLINEIIPQKFCAIIRITRRAIRERIDKQQSCRANQNFARSFTAKIAVEVNTILQEIFTKLTMYNFTELITSHVIIRQKSRKLSYKINFSASVHICRNFLLKNISPPKIETLISRFLIHVKNNICNPRKISTKTAVCLLYRVA